MAEENYEPDWNEWLLVTDVTIAAAVALSLNVDPRRLLAWQMLKNRTQPAEIIKFQDRVYWVEQWKLRGPNWVRENYEGGTRTIYLWEFAQWAKAARWELPAQLMTLAARHERKSPLLQTDAGSVAKPEMAQPIPSHSKNESAALTPSKREARTQRKNNMYGAWADLAIEYGLKESRLNRRRELISKKIASDPRAKDPDNGRLPAPVSVKRRLDKHHPGWAEKSWAEKSSKNSCSSQAIGM